MPFGSHTRGSDAIPFLRKSKFPCKSRSSSRLGPRKIAVPVWPMASFVAVFALGWCIYGPDAEVPSVPDESASYQTMPEALVPGVAESPPANTAPVTVQARGQPTSPKTQTVVRASVGATNPGDGDGSPGPNGGGPPSPPSSPKETPPPPTAGLDYFWYIKWALALAFALVALWKLWPVIKFLYSVCAPVVGFAYHNATGIMTTVGVWCAAKNVSGEPNPPQEPNPPTATRGKAKANAEAGQPPIQQKACDSANTKLPDVSEWLSQNGYVAANGY